MLVTAALFYIPSYIAYAQQQSDQRTLYVLNDALTRYKTQGGNVSALTIGTPIGHVISAMQTPVNWAGMTAQFIQTGVTYPARSLQAVGNGAQYHFVSYNSYTDPALVFGTPTNRYFYGSGVGYMANGSAQAYTINITASTGFYAVKLSSGATTVYASGSHNVGTADSITYWSCVGPAGADNGSNSVAQGNITALTCSSQLLTALDVTGLIAITSLTCNWNLLATLDLSHCLLLSTLTFSNGGNTNLISVDISNTLLTSFTVTDQNNLTKLNATNCTALTSLDCHSNVALNALNVTGCINLTTLNCQYDGAPGLSLDLSTCRNLNSLNVGNITGMTSINVSGTAISSLDVSYHTSLTSIIASNCTSLTSLTCLSCNTVTSLSVSGCPLLASLNAKWNLLSSASINAIFTALPDRTSTTAGAITVSSNTGTAGDTPSIATAKNWTVN